MGFFLTDSRGFRLAAFCGASLLFVAWYIASSRQGHNSLIALHAQMAIDPPFVFRWLLPFLLAHMLPLDWLDTYLTRAAIAWVSVLMACGLMPLYVTRVWGRALDEAQAWRAVGSLLVVLLAHYALPRAYKFYYVYDIPAVVFAMGVFLLLTSEGAAGRMVGIGLAAIFALNRETVIVAVLHAGVWQLLRLRAQSNATARSLVLLLLPSALAALGVLASRWFTTQWMALPPSSSLTWMDGDQLRIVASLRNIATRHQHAFAVLWFGGGALIWLPRRWRYISPPLKAMFVVSLVPGALYAMVGNLTEIRMFSEFIPLFAAALVFKHSDVRKDHVTPFSAT